MRLKCTCKKFILPYVNAIELDGRSTTKKLTQPHKVNDLMTAKGNSNDFKDDSLQSWPTLITANINFRRLDLGDYFHEFKVTNLKKSFRIINLDAHQFIHQLKIQYLQCHAVNYVMAHAEKWK